MQLASEPGSRHWPVAAKQASRTGGSTTTSSTQANLQGRVEVACGAATVLLRSSRSGRHLRRRPLWTFRLPLKRSRWPLLTRCTSTRTRRRTCQSARSTGTTTPGAGLQKIAGAVKQVYDATLGRFIPKPATPARPAPRRTRHRHPTDPGPADPGPDPDPPRSAIPPSNPVRPSFAPASVHRSKVYMAGVTMSGHTDRL